MPYPPTPRQRLLGQCISLTWECVRHIHFPELDNSQVLWRRGPATGGLACCPGDTDAHRFENRCPKRLSTLTLPRAISTHSHMPSPATYICPNSFSASLWRTAVSFLDSQHVAGFLKSGLWNLQGWQFFMLRLLLWGHIPSSAPCMPHPTSLGRSSHPPIYFQRQVPARAQAVEPRGLQCCSATLPWEKSWINMPPGVTTCLAPPFMLTWP